jgi:hypothetical protein
MGMPAFFRAAAAAFLLLTAAAPAVRAETPGANAAQIDPERLKAARELMAVVKADQNMTMLVPMILSQLRSVMPPLAPEAEKARDEVMAEIEKQFKARTGEILDKLAMLYAQRFTADEMRTVAAFYQTEAGQKFVAAMPQLAAEGMRIGQEWGRTIGIEAEQKIRQEMKKRGFKL